MRFNSRYDRFRDYQHFGAGQGLIMNREAPFAATVGVSTGPIHRMVPLGLLVASVILIAIL